MIPRYCSISTGGSLHYIHAVVLARIGTVYRMHEVNELVKDLTVQALACGSRDALDEGSDDNSSAIARAAGFTKE